MIASMNEIEVMARRAARGARLAWGFAEEAGKAARWLAAHGLGGPEQLAGLLGDVEAAGADEMVPAIGDGGVWRAVAGPLSPLVAGAILADRAGEVAASGDFRLGSTAYPLLVAPYAAAAAKLTGATLELNWAGAQIVLAPGGIAIEAEEALTAPGVEGVLCRLANTSSGPLTVPTVRARCVPSAFWNYLNILAHRTFAPASETSRLTGAGAGLTDND